MPPALPLLRLFAACLCLLGLARADAQTASRVVDIPTRPGVTLRALVITPEHPAAAVILFAGGHGGLQISSNGSFKWGEGNFLVRTRERFAARQLLVAVVDAPSDRQAFPYLSGFRQTPEHVADTKALIAWIRQQASVPVWLVGTSRGTQSAAYIASSLPASEGGPDGLVLTSTILSDAKSRSVPDMPLSAIAIPVLVVHHAKDACRVCPPGDLPRLMDKLSAAPRKELLTFDGGISDGDPCEARAYHGYNGIEGDVVQKIADWITRAR